MVDSQGQFGFAAFGPAHSATGLGYSQRGGPALWMEIQCNGCEETLVHTCHVEIVQRRSPSSVLRVVLALRVVDAHQRIT